MTDVTDTAAEWWQVPQLLRGQTFEEMAVGDRFRTSARTITETDLIGFVTPAGDTITVIVEVTASRPASSGPCGVVITRNTVVTRGGGTVLRYGPARLIRGRAVEG
ncbi:hypothetical protein [Actinomadura sp. SCN-SB]|uniref:hypothetical protein n=1 Tax=Actinomadura sp. SCN-SB TaxID=3373092 RepID=UPI003752D5F4